MPTRILTISTTNHICAVCLHHDAQCIAIEQSTIEKSHAALLITLIQTVLHKTGYTLQMIDAIGISAGPGSYTGLRIGMSTAQSLCFALSIPLIKINTLKAMAYALQKHNKKKYHNQFSLICPMIDARRMEVYCLLMDQSQKVIEKKQAKIIDQYSFQTYFLKEKKILFAGDGALKCQSVIDDNGHACYIDLKNITPDDIKAVGVLSYQKWMEKKFEDINIVSPIYLK